MLRISHPLADTGIFCRSAARSEKRGRKKKKEREREKKREREREKERETESTRKPSERR